MKRLILSILVLVLGMSLRAGNFVISHGESVKVFAPRMEGSDIERADRLFAQDYQEVFGEYPVHCSRLEDAKVIVSTYDNADFRKFCKIRGISFDQLAGHTESFVLKVHNNGTQLLVVGSDDRGAAFGLMTLSRLWGVSPFRWWADALALPQQTFELGVAYEKLYVPSIAKRTLILNGVQEHDNYLQDLLLRLRASGVQSAVTGNAEAGTFRWVLNPSLQPYLGLSLALDHPERIRMEALRALDHGYSAEWQIQWGHQLGGELQLLLFFDMAWDVDAYRGEYAVDQLENMHYQQMSGLENDWSRIWNDVFDLAMVYHPEDPQSLEALRRGIGESQSLGMQLSMDLSEKVIGQDYTNAFFRTVEYPINMVSTQMQRLCNIQLVEHGAAKPWAVDDCRQRMELLANELPELVLPKWRQMMGGIQLPSLVLGQSLMRKDGYKVSNLKVGTSGPLPADGSTSILYRSKRGIGTHIAPFDAYRVPLMYQDNQLHLCISMLPTLTYDKPVTCMVSVDRGEPQLIRIEPESMVESRILFNLVFDVDPSVEEHEIVFRTTSDGIYLQRVWLTDIKSEN